MHLSGYTTLALLLSTVPLHAQQTADPIEFSQEEYNQRVSKEMEEMSQALQAMSQFMVKSMNNMTGAINKSAPDIAKNMGELLKSMQPIIKAAEENSQLQEEMLDKEIKPIATKPEAAEQPAETVIKIQTPDTPQTVEAPTITKPNIVYKPKKIQLFPAPQPNY